MSENQNRQPRGIPTGGQYSTSQREEADRVDLGPIDPAASTDPWGEDAGMTPAEIQGEMDAVPDPAPADPNGDFENPLVAALIETDTVPAPDDVIEEDPLPPVPPRHGATPVAAARLREGDVISVGGYDRLITSMQPGQDPDLVILGFDYQADSYPFGKDAVVDRVSRAPLSASEYGDAIKTNDSFRALDDPTQTIDLPDRSTLRIVPDPSTIDENGEVITGIVEKGHYLVTGPDGTETTHPFTDLGERGDTASKIAFAATFAARDSDEPDPAAQTETGDFPTGTTRDGSGIATGPDGTRYVDNPDSFWHGTEIISTYTRSQAIADGALKDHSEMAREAGIAWPVTLTAAAHTDTVTWHGSNGASQDETGRAWDVLNMAALAIRARARRSDSISAGDRIPFEMVRIPNAKGARRPVKVTLHAVLAPDESGQPCWVIMQPNED